MLKQAATFTESFLQGSSYSGDGELVQSLSAFDLVMLCSSWDARSVSICVESGLTAPVCILLMFNARDTFGLRDEHDRQLKEFAKRHFERVIEVFGDSRNVGDVWGKIVAIVQRERCVKGRALSALVDLSACPKYFSLGFVSFGISTRCCGHISILYAEGEYASAGTFDEIAFTEGAWDTIPLPGLSGLFSARLGRKYVVSLGFEGEKTYRAIARADPDRLCAILPDPSVSVEYVQRTFEANRFLLQEFGLQEQSLGRAHAADSIEVWRTLTQWDLLNRDDDNVYFLPCGTKPHGLGFVLYSLSRNGPAVLYNLPEKHTVHRTIPNGRFWRFDISDLSSFI